MIAVVAIGIIVIGVALIGGEKIVKPWPEEIDEWTHFLHEAGVNIVINSDKIVVETRTGKKTKIGRLVRMHADKMEDIASAGAGDIVGLFVILTVAA